MQLKTECTLSDRTSIRFTRLIFVLLFSSLPDGAKFDASSPINKFEDEKNGLVFYVVPVGVCRKPGKTVGLGDAISASGLLHHAKK
jgi:ADP-dependent phosphofructokinase/glucokinase